MHRDIKPANILMVRPFITEVAAGWKHAGKQPDNRSGSKALHASGTSSAASAVVGDAASGDEGDGSDNVNGADLAEAGTRLKIMSSRRMESMEWRLVDFGSAAKLKPGAARNCHDDAVIYDTPAYAPPEVGLCTEKRASLSGMPCDFWP